MPFAARGVHEIPLITQKARVAVDEDIVGLRSDAGEHTREKEFNEAAAVLNALLARRRHALLLAGFALRNVRALIGAWRVIRALPQLDVTLSTSPQGRHLRSLVRRRFVGVPRRRNAVAVAALPGEIDEFLRGRPRQAVRTNITRAKAEGIECTRLSTRAEQARRVADVLATRDEDATRIRDVARERLDAGIDEFFAAVDGTDATLVVAAVTVDQEWAHIGWFVSDPHDERSAEARYLLYVHVFEYLIALGVRYVFVQSAVTLPPGLRYFQRRLGFVPTNLRLSRTEIPTRTQIGEASRTSQCEAV